MTRWVDFNGDEVEPGYSLFWSRLYFEEGTGPKVIGYTGAEFPYGGIEAGLRGREIAFEVPEKRRKR